MKMFESFLLSKEKKIATLFFGAYLALYLAINLLSENKNLMADTIYVFSSLIAFLAGIYSVYFYGINNPRGRALLYISIGILLWFIAEATWVFLDFFSLQRPYPSIADAFFILGYPLLFIGLAKEAHISKLDWKSERTLPMAAGASFLGLAVFYFGIYSAYDPSMDVISNLFSIFYGVGDLLLLLVGTLAIFIILDYRRGKLFVPWTMIMFGFFVILVADIFFSIYEESYIEGIGNIIKIDILWTAGYLFIGYGLTLIALSLKEARDKLIGLLRSKRVPQEK